ncbi:hypothetical protein GALMADRAFT_126549 [Galerina marginata CBS 339.88]|uniref:NACHT domain-containing protein n=1 Tax=Galerina marginata (strain CBS 339.88) TaxID=685588 RepID=A0A067SQU3_GALM3|nr:hypothetical protein GALMADRAFT_126549 [Galerina marginata CBS 339.88]
MYTNSNIVITGGTSTMVHNHTSNQGFEKLGKQVAVGALHNSAEVSDQPKCQPGTRVAILENLEAWAAAVTYKHPIVWLNGPSGSGKSSILRTIAQILFEQRLLLASFFFLRSAPGRNSSNHFIATIAYQIAINIPETRPYIEEAVEKNPLIFSLSIWDQAQALVVSPILSVRRDNPSFDECPFPRIIIIDGLDECSESNKQSTILQVLCRIVKGLPIPLAVLVASRPEHHILHEFSTSGDLNRLSSRLSLENPYIPDGPLKRYVGHLENRLERLDKLLRRLCPDESLYEELNNSIDNRSAEQKYSQLPGSTSTFDAVTPAIRDMNREAETERDMTEDDDETALLLADSIERLQLDQQKYRFSGMSSGAMLVHTALELKNEYYNRSLASHVHPTEHKLKYRRAEFWTSRPWENALDSSPAPTLLFPESDLAESCIELYFSSVNLYLPLLHRPSFQKSIEEGLHYTNQRFAYVFLLVCAVGARYSRDPRVRLDGVESFHSSGWKWFNQVQITQMSLLTPPTLYDLQRLCLSVHFLQGSSVPQSCWTLVGNGIRLAQEVGAHRRKLNNHTLTPEDELWKRAFWVLVCMDRAVSSSSGRPCATHDEDFDLDLPIDCDDEYWDNDDPAKRFKQPPNKPSSMAAFILFIKLHQILAFSLRTIYSINKSKILLGLVGRQWEQHIVAELDSALNKWVDSVPDHLRWEPDRKDLKFFNQSVMLYAQYYHIQILVHRPFIPSLSKPSPLSLPSLAICTNAARSCSRVIDIQRRRNPAVATLPHVQMAVFTSGIVLLLSMWGGKPSGLMTNLNKEMGDVHKCMQALSVSEHQWHSAGQYWDMLFELASVGDLPLPQPSGPSGSANKRERESETPISGTRNLKMSLLGVSHTGPRRIAGSRRTKDKSRVVSHASLFHSQSQAQTQTQMHQHQHQPDSEPPTPASTSMSDAECFPLPVYSNELGKVPLHQGVTFSAQASTFSSSQLGQSQQRHSNNWHLTSGSSDGNAPSPPQPLGMSAGAVIDTTNGNWNGGGTSTVFPDVQHSQPNPGHSMPLSSSSGFGSATVGQSFGTDTASLAMFDNMAKMLGYVQQGSSSAEAEASTVLEESYVAMGMDLSNNRGNQEGQELLAVNDQQQQGNEGVIADEMFDVWDSDTIAMWSNAPSGFELDDWSAYLSNLGTELTDGQHTPTSW